METKPITENKSTQQRQNRHRHDNRSYGRPRNTNYPDNQQVFIGNLKISITGEELKEHFEKYGAVIEVRIKSSADGSANYGFVIFEDSATVRDVLGNKVSIF